MSYSSKSWNCTSRKKTVWLLFNNIKIKNLRGGCFELYTIPNGGSAGRSFKLKPLLSYSKLLHKIFVIIPRAIIVLENLRLFYSQSDSELRCVICTGVTLFALVLHIHLNCTALSQSESSNFFMYIIKRKTRMDWVWLFCCPQLQRTDAVDLNSIIIHCAFNLLWIEQRWIIYRNSLGYLSSNTYFECEIIS